MKKTILSVAFATAIIATIATGCSTSEKAAGNSDSTAVTDSSSTTPARVDSTTRTDTASRDTTRTNPPM
ncbi:hypothetical protein [Mucilaginibacter lacusdianchii]|uniref:hypothetical protein n=1 Tax=Mucilaginibacter lacusdianchii TaxID=2684211 RepID=UPI00131ACE60|nr:hypothetical protein [Mucilaginibacter sp. JXJ CY 39]